MKVAIVGHLAVPSVAALLLDLIIILLEMNAFIARKNLILHVLIFFIDLLIFSSPRSLTGVVPLSARTSTSKLYAKVPKDQMTSDQKELEAIRAKWSQVRHLTKEEAADLEPEWKAAYDRFYEKYESDMVSMTEIASKLLGMIEPPKIEKKTKGQRKRDKWAKVQALQLARAEK
jgi:hypothetical protein